MINKATLIGHLGGDPEIKKTDNGNTVAKISVATNESYKKDDEWHERTEWHNVVGWNVLAEIMDKLTKGDQVYVEGKMTSRKYTDKQGVDRYFHEIVAQKVKRLNKRTTEARNDQPEDWVEPEAAKGSTDGVIDGANDDLPF